MINPARRPDDKRLGPRPADKSCLLCYREGSKEFKRVAPSEGFGNDVWRCSSFRACTLRQHYNRTGKRRDRTWRNA